MFEAMVVDLARQKVVRGVMFMHMTFLTFLVFGR
jgi:hypothetical protein